MADIENLAERYKKECAALLERSLEAERLRDTYKELYEYQTRQLCNAEERERKAENYAKQLEEYKTELLTKLERAEEFIEDRGVSPDAVYNVDPEADADLEETDG